MKNSKILSLIGAGSIILTAFFPMASALATGWSGYGGSYGYPYYQSQSYAPQAYNYCYQQNSAQCYCQIICRPCNSQYSYYGANAQAYNKYDCSYPDSGGYPGYTGYGNYGYYGGGYGNDEYSYPDYSYPNYYEEDYEYTDISFGLELGGGYGYDPYGYDNYGYDDYYGYDYYDPYNSGYGYNDDYGYDPYGYSNYGTGDYYGYDYGDYWGYDDYYGGLSDDYYYW